MVNDSKHSAEENLLNFKSDIKKMTLVLNATREHLEFKDNANTLIDTKIGICIAFEAALLVYILESKSLDNCMIIAPLTFVILSVLFSVAGLWVRDFNSGRRNYLKSNYLSKSYEGLTFQLIEDYQEAVEDIDKIVEEKSSAYKLSAFFAIVSIIFLIVLKIVTFYE